MNRAMYGSRFSGPYCPGVSYYVDDTGSGGKKCKSPTGLEFEIDKDGKCATDSGCSIALTGPVCPGTSMGDLDFPDGTRQCKGEGKVFKINANGDCIDKNNCASTVAELAKAAADKAKELANKAKDSFSKKGVRSRSARKSARKSSRKSKKCYLRKQKGKRSKTRVCLDADAVMRRKRGARKGGRHSHK
jgi:hypothetical protein